MRVVTDSGPLHYLALLDELDLLHRLYGGVMIAPAVADELSAPRTPQVVKERIANSAAWIRIEPPRERTDPIFQGTLDAGECETIALATMIHPDLILLDDFAARREARRRRLRVTGTLGILYAAAELNLVAATDVIPRLQATNFYFDEDLVRGIFAKWL
jgi:predicted nucleic acid-binding protein